MPERRPTVSIALCTCNGEAFLPEQLASISAQTVRPGQIVIMDDASEDRTVPLLRRWLSEPAQAGMAATLIVNPARLGVRANFEAAIQRCNQDLVLLCDQDDVWAAAKIERIAAQFASDPELLFLFTDARLIDAGGRDLGSTLFETLGIGEAQRRGIDEGDPFEGFLRRNLATGATCAMRRALVGRALPIPPDWLHDEWLAVIASCLGRVRASPEPLIAYRQHGGNVIGARKRGLADLTRLQASDRIAGNAYLYRRAQQLLERMEREEGLRADARSGTRIDALRSKVGHLDRRRALPSARMRRTGLVLAEMLRGGYARFSPGWQSVLGDLLAR